MVASWNFSRDDNKLTARAMNLGPFAAQTKAEELRTNADNIRAEECHPDFALELGELAEELADQWDALAVTMVGYCKFA